MIEPERPRLPLFVIRFFLVVTAVPVLAWTAVSRIAREVAGIPKYVWWDWCDEVDAAGHMWRTGEIRGEEEW